jgi:hypothetical protein
MTTEKFMKLMTDPAAMAAVLVTLERRCEHAGVYFLPGRQEWLCDDELLEATQFVAKAYQATLCDVPQPHKVIQITEGTESKGGQNPPNTSSQRPPPPGGSATQPSIDADLSAAQTAMDATLARSGLVPGQDGKLYRPSTYSLEPSDPSWGQTRRYLTDDRDLPAEKQRELSILPGGNGDWYVSVDRPGGSGYPGVRICTSGGASSAAPGLAPAIADAYRAMGRQKGNHG